MQSELIDSLRAIVGNENVLTDATDCAPYEEDWRRRYKGRSLCVVRPANTSEVSAVVRVCSAAGVAMVPQGGNTSHCGGGIPTNSGREVLISLLRMNRIRETDLSNNTITVEAGCVLAKIQQHALEHQRLFPLSLAAEGSCVIGGNLATNAGGVQVLRYGNAREMALGLEVVLPDGQVWDGLRGLRKDNTGYDLTDLFIGSEGTLGIITAAVLKLFPLPTARVVAWVAVADVEQTIQLLTQLTTRCGERLTAFEIVGAQALDLVLRHIQGATPPLGSSYPWCALIEVADSTSQELLGELFEEALELAFESGLILDAAVATSEAQAKALWALREDIAEAQRIEGVSIKHDVSVPVSQIPTFIKRAEMELNEAFPGVRIVAFGHAGDGNIHYNLSMHEPSENKTFVARSAEVSRLVHDLVAEFRGSISAEHGLGQLKRDEILRYKSTVEMNLMRLIKHSFDPKGLMNPGKVL